MCIDFISNQHQHEQALCTLHLFRKNPTVSRNSPDNAGVLLPNWENPNSLLSWNSPDNAGGTPSQLVRGTHPTPDNAEVLLRNCFFKNSSKRRNSPDNAGVLLRVC